MFSKFNLDMAAISITQNNSRVLLICAGKTAADTLSSIVRRYTNNCELYRNLSEIPVFYEENLRFSAVSKKVFSYDSKNYKYAVVAFDNNDELAVKFTEKICPALKSEGICTVSVTVDTFDSGGIPIRTELPLEICRKNIIDSSDALVITHLENYAAGTIASAILSRMVIMLLDSYMRLTYEEKDFFIERIKNSGIAYYSETFSEDFLPLSDFSEKSVFDSLFQCPYFAASTVFCNVAYGYNWDFSDCAEEVFSAVENLINSGAFLFTSSEPCDFFPDDALRFQFLFFGFDGKSSVFDEDYSYIYPEFPNRNIKNSMEIMLDNYCEDF